jgi:thiazole synthase
MRKAVEAGREAFLAGRMPKKTYRASASSPTTGVIGSSASGSSGNGASDIAASEPGDKAA